MTLGEKLKQARLQAGLSQRELCGDTITRNMLSQIENGQAQPSMSTLQTLAQRLEKSVSFFLGEEHISEDPQLHSLRQLESARHLLLSNKATEALVALTEAEPMIALAPDWIKRHFYLMKSQLLPDYFPELPSLDGELLLRARQALAEEKPQRALALLAAMETPSPLWQGEAWLALGDYAQAAQAFRQAEADHPHRACQCLEICYRELEDYQQAYFYACRNREL